MLVLADPGGEPLERLLGRPMAVAEFLQISVPLATAIGRLHASGLIHKDLKPANILVDMAKGSVRLTGFGIASRLPREHQSPTPPEVIAGTLAYMAPEQTGRMNRSVDSRSDLYALGVTFYEMLTGVLPFTATDPMEWVHCHIARQPAPPDERVAGIPRPLSAIVLKLLAKTADDRYQTAAGLKIDLQRCLAEWQAAGTIRPFPLGQQDASDRLLIPEKLYGRERETETLLAAFNRVVASGTPELVLVSGYSGIGKSSVVNELHKALVPPRGLFASGKFDQYQRDIPYATLAQAFRSLVRTLLGQSEAELGRWRDALCEALGPNGQLIVNLVPELELVIGKPPPVPDLPPQDAQNRFQLVFRRFLGVFAQAAHPLALFLDDLQWLDIATLDLLEHLVTHSEVRHLLLVGAYRDNEVGPAHPLRRTLEAIRQADARVQAIVLGPLGRDDVRRLVADALHCAPERARSLAQLVHEKTRGNPFFAIQFLTALADEGLLTLDLAMQAWQWSIDRIRAKNYTDNVVDLMAEKLKRLPAATREALQQLACLGNVAQTTTLMLVRSETEAAIHAVLWDAVYAGLVVNTDHAYKFLHDRIQQAAYSLIPQVRRADVHLHIGRALASRTAPEDLEEKIFEIVNQLDRGAAVIDTREEREQVAGLNLIAGKHAKTSTAYASALNYLAAGRALLAEDSWERQYELIFSIEYHRAECELLLANLAAAEELLIMLSRRAGKLVDIAAVACLRLTLYTTVDRSDRSVEVCLEYLQRVGVHWSPHPTKDEVRAEYERIWQQLGKRAVEELVDLPLMRDPECRATLDVLTEVVTPALFTDENLLSLVICRMVNLSLQHGNSDGSCFAFVWFGMILGPHFGNYRAGFRFGTLGYNLVEQRGLHRYQARTYMSLGNLVMPWTKHVQAGRDLVRRAFDAANKIGDSTFAAYSCNNLNTNLLAAGDSLVDAQHEAEHGLDFAQKARFGLVIDIITAQLALIRTLRGLTPEFGSFNDEIFNESRFEYHLQSDPRLALPECWYWVRKLQARVYANDYDTALAAASKAQQLLWTSPSFFEVAEYHFYAALARAAHCDAASAAEPAQHLAALAAHYRQLEEWAQNCPENFTNRVSLVAAEIARLEGRALDAMHFYERAIQSARKHGFVQNEGLAHEAAARFYAARGFETIAEACLRNARYCYLRWGALGKVRQLEQLHAKLLEDAMPRPPSATAGTSVEQLDIGAVVKASQAVSGEIMLDRLTETLMTIALEHAGAERGLLLLPRGDALHIEAEARTAGETIEVTLRQAPVTPAVLPETVLHTVVRTQHSVILDDASAPNPFAVDAYLRQMHARSVLCLPLVKQAKLIGVLYLENNLASHVFTPARISVLELLASQAAISLENAQLYADLRFSEERWRNLFENIPVGVTLTGSDGRYVTVNQAFQRMTGYSAAELRKLSPADITHEDDRSIIETIIAAPAAGTPYPQHVEKRYRRKDGAVIWVDSSAFVASVVAGAPLFAGVARDVTDRKRAEEELRRSEASLAQAQHISQTGSWRWNVGTGELSSSVELLCIFGFDPGVMRPSYMTFTERIHPEDRPPFEQALASAVRDGSAFQREYRIILPDRSVKRLQTVGKPGRTASGELEFFGTVMDITERRRAEEALRDAQAELARVARVTTLGELAASLAHEITQPLAAIALNAESGLLWLNQEQPSLDEAREAFSRIERDGARANEVIRGLRALAKKSGPQLTRLDIHEAIEEVLVLTRGELHRHGVVLHTDLCAAGRPVSGDRVQLQQVLLNLIMNGIQAMAAVTDRPRELTVSTALAEPGLVQVVVEDTGPGLDPAIAPRIFDPFFTTKSDGLGMGLSICRSIIEAHAGDLWASPRTPHGTTFHFTVPIAAEA
jgi:PAS domain S-box-containing protein